jgi:hypothetical protein
MQVPITCIFSHYLELKYFLVATVALPNTSELSFTMVCADLDPATFCVALCKNCLVSVIAALIDCDACLDGVVGDGDVAVAFA